MRFECSKGKSRKERKERGSERGAAALELSVMIPSLMLLMFGVFEFGYAFSVRESLVSAAAEAARVGSQSSCPRPTAAQVEEAVRSTLSSAGLDPSLAGIVLTNAGGESGTDIVVDLSYEVQFPVLSKLLASTWMQGGMEMTVRVDAENE